jgi:hypothetical protein
VGAAVAKADSQHVVDVLCAMVGQAEIEPDEMVGLIATAAAKAKTGVRPIQARLKAERARIAAARRQAQHEQQVVRDKRLTRPLPPPDGARTPVITVVDEALASDPSAEPPMRDAVGNTMDRTQPARPRARKPTGRRTTIMLSVRADRVSLTLASSRLHRQARRWGRSPLCFS